MINTITLLVLFAQILMLLPIYLLAGGFVKSNKIDIKCYSRLTLPYIIFILLLT